MWVRYLIVCVCSPVFSSSPTASSNSAACFLAQHHNNIYSKGAITTRESQQRETCPHTRRITVHTTGIILIGLLSWVSRVVFPPFLPGMLMVVEFAYHASRSRMSNIMTILILKITNNNNINNNTIEEL